MLYSKLPFFLRNRVIVVGVIMAIIAPMGSAAERVLRIEAPSVVLRGTELSVNVTASADGTDNERVGFLHVEASTDGGQNWVALCYLTDGAQVERRRVSLPVGAEASQVRIRARAAFRSDKGDVDYRGGAIQWDKTWDAWAEPPARLATVVVKNR